MRGLSQMLGSNALVGVVGVLSLPFLARNLGPSGYGHFSLFLTGLGLLSSLDIARPTLIREFSGVESPAEKRKLLALMSMSQLLLAPLSFLLGAWFFGVLAGLALACGVFFFIAASSPFALLAAEGRVGLAVAVRNIGWAVAFALATGLSFLQLPPHVYLWPFVAANVGIFAVNRRLAGAGRVPLFVRPDLSLLGRYRERSLDIFGLSLAVAVVVSADKLMLERSASAEVFGAYTAQYDLATKINLLSTALGTVLFPLFASQFATQGFESAARRFIGQLTRIVPAYWAVLMVLLWFNESIVSLMLGAEFTSEVRIYPLMLVGVFLALFGHLLTPWQRACGDFRTHRRAYALSAVLMLAVGAYAIPSFGAAGAVAAYLTARIADLLLIATELKRIPREILSPWRVVALGLMISSLIALATYKVLGVGVAL